MQNIPLRDADIRRILLMLDSLAELRIIDTNLYVDITNIVIDAIIHSG